MRTLIDTSVQKVAVAVGSGGPSSSPFLGFAFSSFLPFFLPAALSGRFAGRRGICCVAKKIHAQTET